MGTSILPFDFSSILPRTAQVGATDKETIENLLEWCRKMQTAMTDYVTLLNTIANAGFTSVTDGTTTQNSADNSTLYISADGSASVTLESGVMTFTSTDTTYTGDEIVTAINTEATTTISAGKITLSEINTSDITNDEGWTSNTTYYKTGTEFAAIIAGGNVDMVAGDLCYITADYSTTYYQGEMYRYNGSGWNKVYQYAYNTTITAGYIIVSSTKVTADDSTVLATFLGSASGGWAVYAQGSYMTHAGMGCFSSYNGKSLVGTLSGSFRVGEIVTQATTGAIGKLYTVNDLGGSTSEIWIKVTSGTFSTGYEVTGGSSSATITPTEINNHSYPTAGFNKDGQFFFDGDDDNYIGWDGSNLSINAERCKLYVDADNYFEITASGATLKCESGYIGNTTDHFDITNGVLALTDGHIALADSSGWIYLKPSSGVMWQRAAYDFTFFVDTYSDTLSDCSHLSFRKSHVDTLESYSTTQNTDSIGRMNFDGIDSNNKWQSAVTIQVSQSGSAGSGYVPGGFHITVTEDASTQTVFTIYNNGIISGTYSGSSAAFKGKFKSSDSSDGVTATYSIRKGDDSGAYSLVVKDGLVISCS